MLKIVTRPPSGVKESCIAFTAPQEASVVIVAKSAELKTPKRVSFPSMLPSAASTPSGWWAGFPAASAQAQPSAPARNRSIIAAHTDHPCAWLPVIRPRYQVSPLPRAKMESIWRKLESGEGFSNGCAAFALV